MEWLIEAKSYFSGASKRDPDLVVVPRNIGKRLIAAVKLAEAEACKTSGILRDGLKSEDTTREQLEDYAFSAAVELDELVECLRFGDFGEGK